jgi:hypothetical protein
MPAAVDAALFECLQDAIAFVASAGGGVVRTELFGTVYAGGLKLPHGVTLEPAPAHDDGSSGMALAQSAQRRLAVPSRGSRWP